MKKYKILEKELFHKGYSSLEFVRVAYETIDGSSMIEKTFEVYTSGDSVAALVFHKERKEFIFVRQFRCALIGKHDPWLLELVAGGVDADEKLEDAVRRELLEEIGYQVGDLQKIQSFYVTPGRSSEFQHIYYAEVSDNNHMESGGGLDSEDEDLEIIYLGLDEARQALNDQRFIDGKTVIAIQWFFAHKA